MPRHGRKHGSRHAKKSHKMRGGASAASYAMEVVGPENAQFDRVFSQSGPYAQVPGNTIIGTGGQNIPSPSQIPTAAQMNLIQSAGKRRKSRGRRSRSRRGGFLGAMVNQAVVPLTLLGMQQTYRRRRNANRQTRRR